MASWRWRFHGEICKRRFVLETSCLRKQCFWGPFICCVTQAVLLFPFAFLNFNL